MREIGHDCSLINCSMNTPISYYGGKQRLVNVILPMIPDHTLYAEPFCGGAAIFFAKQPSLVEVINDTNGEVVNFYEVLKTDFERLKARVEVSMHSRQMHSDASVIYNNPHLFGKCTGHFLRINEPVRAMQQQKVNCPDSKPLE